MGTGRGRPGGNPNINQNPQTFSTERPEPLSAKLSMRITASMLQELKQHQDWQELVREAIATALETKRPGEPQAQEES